MLPKRRISIAGLVIAAAAMTSACPAQAAFPGENGRIMVAPTGSPPILMDADGTHHTPVPHGAAGAVVALSADGNQEAYSPAGAGLIVRDLRTGVDTPVVDPGHTIAAAAFSPDGQQVAWQEAAQVFRTSAAGGNPAEPVAAEGPDESFGRGIAWTPDGTRIVIGESLPGCAPNGCSAAQLIAVSTITGTRRRITPPPDFVDNDEGEYLRPDVAGDASKVVFLLDESPPVASSFTGLETVPLAGGSVTEIKSAPHGDIQLTAAAPDGTSIIYAQRLAAGGLAIRGTAGGDHSIDNNGGAGYAGIAALQWLPTPACADGDRDGDGLCDSWERSGIDANGDGTIDLKLYDADGDGTISQSEQADPDHKDLYVEIDTMNGEPVDPAALRDVVHAFFVAPVLNPDGTPGINLHVELDDTVPQTPIIAFTPCTRPAQAGEADFDQLKGQSFGSAGQRASDAAVLDAKRLAFRYVLWAHALAGLGSTSGCSELPGNDLVVTLGKWTAKTRDVQAGTFMHEFGHALGLHHGGLDDDNCKPNYLSVMNYTFQIAGNPIAHRPLDYSRAALPTLFESVLNEPAGLGGPVGGLSAFGPVPQNIIFTDQPVDWNLDGDTTDVGVQANLDFNPAYNCSGAGTTLIGANDWKNLVYDFRSSPDFADGIHSTAQSLDEMTHEQAVANSTDSDGDGVGDFEDDCVCATAPPPCADAKPPDATLRTARVRHGKLRLSGTAVDATQCAAAQGAVARVEAAIGLRAGKRCQFLDKHGKPGSKRSCDKPAFLTAHGTATWKLKVKRPPPGRYRIEVRASDSAGNLSAVVKRRLSIGGRGRG